MRGFRPVESVAALPPTRAASARIYDDLRHEILSGRIAAGTLFSEVKLAEQLGLSRTPLREAFRTLLSDGLLEEGPNRQVQVRVFPAEAIDEVTTIVGWMLRLAIDQAARHGSPTHADGLRLITIRIRRALRQGDEEARFDEEDEFRLQLTRAAEMPVLEEVLRRMFGQARLMSMSHGAPSRRRPRNSDVAMLDTIADAIERGDAEPALSALEAYPFGPSGALKSHA